MKYLIKSATVINEGSSEILDVLIENERIAKIAKDISDDSAEVINAEGLWLIPGAIDDQVHFREPGLTHKGEIYTEAKAAVAGGITSYMEMPNTVPNVFTQALLEDKYQRAAEVSLANYTFFMGTSNDNLEEVLRTNTRNVCGVKIFMGSSTGNMLVDNPSTLESIFAQFSGLIATHCEDEMTIKRNQASFKEKYGDKRRTQIIKRAIGNFKDEDLIPDEEVVITLTKGNYIKRIVASEYRAQGRGGKGKIGMAT